MRCPRRLKDGSPLTRIALPLSLALIAAAPAHASNFRLGVALGLGAAGIDTTATVSGTSTSVQRSEGPGTLGLSLDYMVNDQVSIALDHERGFRIGPFSSGVTFTGLTGRWFFKGPMPSVAQKSPEQSQLIIHRFIPFVGLGAGVAQGTISRTNDQVAEISASAVYFGYRIGAEYQLLPGLVLRPEIHHSFTMMYPGQLSLLALQCGALFFF